MSAACAECGRPAVTLMAWVTEDSPEKRWLYLCRRHEDEIILLAISLGRPISNTRVATQDEAVKAFKRWEPRS